MQYCVAVRVCGSGAMLCARGLVADTFLTRLLGLLRRGFAGSDGLLLRPSSAVHTLGMAFPIDVLALDRQGQVVGMRSRLRPGRIAIFSLRTREVLELPAGLIERSGVAIGDSVELTLRSTQS